MEYLFIYLLQVTEIIQNCGRFTLLLAVTSLFVTIISIGYYCEEKDMNPTKHCGIVTAILLVLCLVLNFFPTKQTLLLMGGTYLGKKAVNAVVTDEKIKKVDTIINLQLDKYIKELRK